MNIEIISGSPRKDSLSHRVALFLKKYLSEKDASIVIFSQEGFKEEMRITVNHGVFMGNEGTVIRGGKKKVYVKLESLGQVMVVEFPAEFLSPI